MARSEPERRQQKDLFLDAQDVAAAHALVRTILSRKAAAAREQLARLRRLNAEHWMLPSASVLVDAIAVAPPKARDQALQQLQALEGLLLPASRVLGNGARDFVTPLWHRVAETLDDGMPFDPAKPKEHASFAFQKSLDWENVRRSVTDVPNHRSEPALLEPLAEAEWRTRNRSKALAVWFRLCWLAPDHFAEAMRANRIPDAGLCRSWERLQDQDWRSPNTAAWLPAWMLLEEPGIARSGEPANGPTAPEQGFDVLLGLKTGGAEPNLHGRRALQRLHPELLDCLLKQLE